MRILALDCGTKTGWCVADDQKIIESGVLHFPLNRGESPGMRFLRFRAELVGLLQLTRPEIICYEQAHHRGGAATEVSVGMTTRVQEIAAQSGIDVFPCHSGTLKKWATGKGNADKPAMCAVAATFLGREPEDDNEADAVCLARWVVAVLLSTGPSDNGNIEEASNGTGKH